MPTYPLGDLTDAEVQEIQSIVDRVGRPLEVVGSAARVGRRGVGTTLPIGKGSGTRSDVDYLVAPSNVPYYQGWEHLLPGIDLTHGIIPGLGNPHVGPVIRFEPGTQPRLIQAVIP